LKQALFMLAACICLLARPAGAQLIGVYRDASGGSCNLSVAFPGPPVDAYVVFTPGGGVSGIQGARLRIHGLPEGWSTSVSANPSAAQADTDLFGWGAQINFAECQAGPVVLWHITLSATSTVVDHQLRTDVHRIQPGGGMSCPAYFSCLPDTPQEPLSEASALLNSASVCDPELLGRCPTGTDVPWLPERFPWSVVKQLYR